MPGLTCSQFPASGLEGVVRGREGEVRQADFVGELSSLAGLLPSITRHSSRHQGVERLPPALTETNVLELLHTGAQAEMSVDGSQLGQGQTTASHPSVSLDQLFRRSRAWSSQSEYYSN